MAGRDGWLLGLKAWEAKLRRLLTVISVISVISVSSSDMLSHYTVFNHRFEKDALLTVTTGHTSVWTCASVPTFTFARYDMITGRPE